MERISYKGILKDRPLPRIFTESQINLILKTLYKSKDYWKADPQDKSRNSLAKKEWGNWLKMRDVCLIATIYILGTRPNESCSLKFSDFDLKSMTVRIDGKNNKTKKDRIIPVPKILFKFYKDYFKFSKERFWRGSPYLFPTFESTNHISPERLKGIFREKCLKPAGLWDIQRDSKAQYRTLYRLRHSRASHILNKQVKEQGKPDLFAICNFLGHSDIRSTMVYLHTDSEYQEYLRDQIEF